MDRPHILKDILIPWYVRSTNDYELIYLDPSACDLNPRQRGVLSSLFGRSENGSDSLVRELSQLLQSIASRTAPDRFLDENGIGSVVKKQRATQRKISKLINHYSSESKSGIPHFVSAENFRQQQSSILESADQRSAASLISVDSMFATLASLPQESAMTLRLAPERRYGSLRRLEAVLLNLPPRLAMLGDVMVPLLMDSRATSNWTESLTTMMSAGWYPCARVIGLSATNAQGHFYIDVIAVLVRPWPDTASMFHTDATNADGQDLSSLLRQVRSEHLEPIIQALAKAQQEASESDGIPEPILSLESYKELLSPILFVQLLAYLNGIHGSALKLRAPQAYREIDSYLKSMTALGAFRDEQSEQLSLGMDLKVEQLLPEPTGWQGGKKVPLVI